MEWSSGKNRMASALERLLHPKPKKKGKLVKILRLLLLSV